MSVTDCTVVIPFRAVGDSSRIDNLHTVLRWLVHLPVSVVVSEQSEYSHTNIADSFSVKHVWEKSDEPFSKSAACNAGVVLAETPLIALVDADTMVRSQALLACIQRIARPEGKAPISAIRPFGRLIDLGQQDSLCVQSTGDLPESITESPDNSRAHEYIPLTGGIVVMDKDAYMSVGGMDESFKGWGGEDDAFSSALVRMGFDCRVLSTEVGYHLWHVREPAVRYEHDNYVMNARRAQWWRECTDADFHDAVKAGNQRLSERQR